MDGLSYAKIDPSPLRTFGAHCCFARARGPSHPPSRGSASEERRRRRLARAGGAACPSSSQPRYRCEVTNQTTERAKLLLQKELAGRCHHQSYTAMLYEHDYRGRIEELRSYFRAK